MITAKIYLTPNAYGFGTDLNIILTKKRKGKVEKIRNFWLGQTAKFFARAIGWNLEDFVRHCEQEYGSRDFENRRVYKETKELVLNAITDEGQIELKQVFEKAEAWNLCVE